MDISTSFAILLLVSSANWKPASSNENNLVARDFNNTAVFTKIIPSTDISSRNAIYITPELLFVGKSNGNILRCLFKDPNVCEMFYSYGSSVGVTAVVLNGEYLYASLANGVMLICSLHEKRSCTTFNGHGRMNTLAISGGYIHAGMQDGRMLRCELNQLQTCKNFNVLKSAITSLAVTEKYIYAALESKEIWRCLLSSENSCRLFERGSKFSSQLQELLVINNTLYGVTGDGKVWNCTHGQPCTNNSLPYSGLTSTIYVNGSLFVLESSNIQICEWGSFGCRLYEHHEGALSMSFAYSTYQMQERFTNEDRTCLSDSRCPPFMTYYKVNERHILEVFVKDGKLYNSQGVLVDTRNADVGHSGQAAIFAMGPDGQILLSNVHNTVLKTSSLFAGHPVASAGEIVVENGVIQSIRACSDHYRPDVDLNQQVIKALSYKGYTGKIDSLPSCKALEVGQTRVEEEEY